VRSRDRAHFNGSGDGVRGRFMGSFHESNSRIRTMNRLRRTFVAYATKGCTGGDAGSWREFR